ncbi:MAG: HIT family protein [Planctomycetes bacterium]|nr:HIT family protein [Planctomycetota bacterium]
MESGLLYVIHDRFPVSPGHSLIITKRHVADYFDTTDEERAEITAMLSRLKRHLDERFRPNGYNIGVNCGESAGQSMMHLHVHLIPRYQGDVRRPRGGVRGVIPSKQSY